VSETIDTVRTNPVDSDPDRHVRGARDAPHVVVEYGDFECPYCLAAWPVLRRLVEESDGEVRLVYRHFPIFSKHPHALTAALAAEAAGDRFWEMHDLLFAHQNELGEADLAAYGAQVGAQDVVGPRAQRYRRAVEADYLLAGSQGVRGTPTLFLDGARYDGRVELAALRRALGLRS
jgi:protein-disulfide isomerase